MKSIFTHIGLLIASVVVVYVVAVTQDTIVFNKEDLKSISCGLPFQFATSDQSWRNPPYPWTVSCGGGEFGDSVVIDWPAFLGNVIIYYLLLNLLFKGFRTMKNKAKYSS